MNKHLWEVDHSYYCNERNYYNSNEYAFRETWQDFIDEFEDSDLDLNLVFRFDWNEDTDEDGEPLPFDGNMHRPNATLQVFFMAQRKGRFFSNEVRVCRADEPAVIEFLKPRFQHMLSLWAPFTA